MRALVTGAAAGLGRAITDQLLSEGHEVVAVDIDGETLDRLAIASRGALISRPCDLSDAGALAGLLATLPAQPLDLVVLNAGISAAGRFEDIPADRHAKVVALNLTAPLTMASTIVRDGLMAKGATMVLVSSLSHVTGYPGASVYAATKDALAVYAKSVRKPWKKRGIRTMTVFPGPIRTAHAERYAPPGASAGKRMEPAKLAGIILKTAKKPPAELYPGGTMARMAAGIAPGLVLRGLRKALLDKMDKPRL